MKKLLVYLVLFFLSSCAPNSSKDFQQEAEERSRAIVRTLAQVENREQLVRLEPILKQQFEDLIHLIMQVDQFQEKHYEHMFIENSQNALLEEQLRRVYAIEGGREVIERAQREALITLDAYERAALKKREKLGFK